MESNAAPPCKERTHCVTGAVISATSQKRETSDASDSKGADRRSDCSTSAYKEVDDTRLNWSVRTPLGQSKPDCTAMGFPQLEISDPSKSAVPPWKVSGGDVVSHKFKEPLADGQGVDFTMKLQAEHAGKITVELVQPKKPYAQTLNEEIDVSPE